MDVVLTLAGLALLFALYRAYTTYIRLQDEKSQLAELLDKTLTDHDRNLNDHLAAEQQLAIIKAKLETLQSSTITPENSIPKQVHIEKVLELSQSLVETRAGLDEMTKKFEESRGKQISERVRLGQVGENFAAFHDQFPYDRSQVKALFQPVDLIYFGDDEVVFIDVKTGGSNLSKKQRQIRDNIKAGNVRFEVHRLDENGYDIKRD